MEKDSYGSSIIQLVGLRLFLFLWFGDYSNIGHRLFGFGGSSILLIQALKEWAAVGW